MAGISYRRWGLRIWILRHKTKKKEDLKLQLIAVKKIINVAFNAFN